MILTGIFPVKLKIAKICPIYKKDDEKQFTNYRPISLLPAISKIFEKVIYRQLYDFFQENKLFFNGQYGFRNDHNTEYACLEVIDRILLDTDSGDIPISIFLDLSISALWLCGHRTHIVTYSHAIQIQTTDLKWREAHSHLHCVWWLPSNHESCEVVCSRGWSLHDI